MQTTKSKPQPNTNYLYLAVAGIVIGLLAMAIFDSSVANRQNSGTPLSLDLLQSGTGASNIYTDTTCGISFSYPAHWQESSIRLPLEPEPLFQMTFDEKSYKSLFSYVCHDGTHYKVDTLVAGSSGMQSPEQVSIGGETWLRTGNLLSATIGDKVIILQMFLTKYDVTPKPGYEETFIGIARTVQPIAN